MHAGACVKKLAAIHPKRWPGWAWADRVVALIRTGVVCWWRLTPDLLVPHRSFRITSRTLGSRTEARATSPQLAAVDTWRQVVLLAYSSSLEHALATSRASSTS